MRNALPSNSRPVRSCQALYERHMAKSMLSPWAMLGVQLPRAFSIQSELRYWRGLESAGLADARVPAANAHGEAQSQATSPPTSVLRPSQVLAGQLIIHMAWKLLRPSDCMICLFFVMIMHTVTLYKTCNCHVALLLGVYSQPFASTHACKA